VDQGVEVAKVFDQDNFMCGILKLSPGACKSPDTVKSPEVSPLTSSLFDLADSDGSIMSSEWITRQDERLGVSV